jgi:hypothetical protein
MRAYQQPPSDIPDSRTKPVRRSEQRVRFSFPGVGPQLDGAWLARVVRMHFRVLKLSQLTMVLAFVGSATLPACDPQACPSGSSSSDSARCVGRPVEAYEMNDAESCLLQGAEWDDFYGDCRGTTFTVYCARAEEIDLPFDVQRQKCLDMPGCGWTEDDGSIRRPSGRCEGEKIPCHLLSEDLCDSQPGCISLDAGCEVLSSYTWLNNVGCENLQIADDVSYSVVRSACERAMGCSWVDDDGANDEEANDDGSEEAKLREDAAESAPCGGGDEEDDDASSDFGPPPP